jgi:hypothetical protein
MKDRSPAAEIVTFALLLGIGAVGIRAFLIIVGPQAQVEPLAASAPQQPVQTVKNQRRYTKFLDTQSLALKDGDLLPRAARRVSSHLDETGYVPPPSPFGSLEPSASREARLAALLVRQAGIQVNSDTEAARKLLNRLRVEYQTNYRASLPDFAFASFPSETHGLPDHQDP